MPLSLSRCLRAGIVLVAMTVCLSIFGCKKKEEAAAPPEIKRIDQVVTEEELDLFLKVIDRLPGKNIRDFPEVFTPVAGWTVGRSLPIGELVREEIERTEEHWDIHQLARRLRHKKPLMRALQRYEMSSQKFVSLALALGLATARTTIRPEQDLARLAEDGEIKVKHLRNEPFLFSSLSPEARATVLRQGMWVTRLDRAKHLLQVPPENVELVRKHLQQMNDLFPEQFTTNPLDPVADVLVEIGVPLKKAQQSATTISSPGRLPTRKSDTINRQPATRLPRKRVTELGCRLKAEGCRRRSDSLTPDSRPLIAFAHAYPLLPSTKTWHAGYCAGHVGTQFLGFAEIHVHHLRLLFVRVHVNQHAYAAGRAVRNRNFRRAQERHLVHSQRAGRLGGKRRREILRGGENRRNDLVKRADGVRAENFLEQLAGGSNDFRRDICVDARCTANSTYRHRKPATCVQC